MPDRLAVGSSRKHIVSDRIPTTAYVMRRVSWMLLVRESRRQMWAHGSADAGDSKWVPASREPTTTPPRARDPRALGMSTSALRRSESRSDQDSVRTKRLDPRSSHYAPRPRSQCGNTPAKQRITPLPLLLRRLRLNPVNLPAASQGGNRHPVPERDPRGSSG